MSRIDRKHIFAAIAVVTLVIAGISFNTFGQQQTLEKAADFKLESVNDGQVSLSDALKKGKAVLVFSATWCPYCVEEIPAVNDFYSKNKDKVSVIGIDIREDRAKVENFSKKKNILYPVLLDTTGDVARAYKVRGIPTVIAVDESRKILYEGHSITDMGTRVKF